MQNLINVYTDGACSGNPGPGGWGAIIYDKDMIELARHSGRENGTTNNKMELKAVSEALQFLKNHKNTTINLYSDSNQVIMAMKNWIFNWQKNGWTTANKKKLKINCYTKIY